MSVNRSVSVGQYLIEVSPSHIYLADELSPTYDYMPWNLIGEIIQEAGLKNPLLLDIGANVGDSLAHFRRQSSAPAMCVEPDDTFFEILRRNCSQFDDVALYKSLLVPDEMVGRVEFSSGGQTGKTELVHGEGNWSGEYVTFSGLLTDRTADYIIKSDTDGFDLHIMNDLGHFLDKSDVNVPVIFFEGPSADQLQGGDIADWCDCVTKIQEHGYHILILNNHGLPYCYAGSSSVAVESCIKSLVIGYSAERAMCHYFDFIAIRNTLEAPTFRLQKKWGEGLFRRT